MTCQEFWDKMPESADGTGPFDHVKECPACAAVLERQRALTACLKRLREDQRSVRARDAVEARLVEAFRAQMRPPSGFIPRPWLAWGAGVAVLLLLSMLLIRLRIPEAAPLHAVGDVQMAAVHGANDSGGFDAADFVPLPYGVADSDTGGDEEDLVRVEVPSSALIALGLPISPDGNPGRVEAVVALGTDGMLKGVRVLQ